MTTEHEDYAKKQAELAEKGKERVVRLLLKAEERELCIMEIIKAYWECGNFTLSRLLGLIERELMAAFDKNWDAHLRLFAIRDKMDKGKFDEISVMFDEITYVLGERWNLIHIALKGEITHESGKEIIRDVEKALMCVLNKTSDILSLRPF